MYITQLGAQQFQLLQMEIDLERIYKDNKDHIFLINISYKSAHIDV